MLNINGKSPSVLSYSECEKWYGTVKLTLGNKVTLCFGVLALLTRAVNRSPVYTGSSRAFTTPNTLPPLSYPSQQVLTVCVGEFATHIAWF